MIRIAIAAVALLLCCSACNNKQAIKAFTDAEGGFSAPFGKQPLPATEEERTDMGSLQWHAFSEVYPDSANIHFKVKYVDIPAKMATSDSLRSIQAVMDAAQKDFFNSMRHAAIDNVTIMQLAGYPGRGYHWVDKGNGVTYTRRVFLVKNRMYIAEVKSRMETDMNDKGRAFLDGFVVQAPNNPNPEVMPELPTRNFELSFPAQSTARQTPIYNDLFGTLYAVMEYCQPPANPAAKNVFFSINYFAMPARILTSDSVSRIKTFLHNSVTDNADKRGGTVLLEKPITVDGYYGLESMVSWPAGGKVMHFKEVIARNYYYQLLVISNKGLEGNEEAKAFMASFRVK